MKVESSGAAWDPMVLARELQTIAEQSQRLMLNYLARQPDDGHVGLNDPGALGGAFLDLLTKMMTDPAAVASAQIDLFNDSMTVWRHAAERMLLIKSDDPPPPRDKRFAHPDWSENAVFSFIRESYLVASKSLLTTVRGIKDLDPKTARKVDFYTRQFVDAMSPSNFLATNPEVLATTVESGGQNLLHGLEHVLADLEEGHGRLQISMTGKDAFQFGETIAATPGKVVFQNDLLQLLQYSPSTETVRKRPLFIIMPWINKFYVLDLQPKNSFIKWAVDQGHTVFVPSWANPDENLAQTTFEDYMTHGLIAAFDAIEAATGEHELNAIGYCLGGTMLAATMAYLAAKGDNRVVSATNFVTLIDFTEVGDMAVFIDDEQISSVEKRMAEHGYLEASDMAMSFNMLRSNDLIWSFVVNNYLLGKEPAPFDLLYWNADATRMPAVMHSFYMRNMYQKNLLKEPGGITLAGTPIDLRLIKTPVFMLSCREDHLAPWKSTYAATHIYGGPVTFVLAASGHLAGVISPPGSKYGHWTNDKLPPTPDEWFATATAQKGSWWPLWDKWVTQYAGGWVPARTPGEGKLPAIEDAPGSYVRVRAV
ncbi:polyhydroxyalkanoate synthase [Roseiarcus fermentans]|uniref:Polyhydroxyalkanoate synthase n=1 Tax=Roseiarcus fermentans TaxID=1473586 RepID=A0A366FDK8_9HYPH|nr:class I poly(R)-hydroxyalkanoic acid synthase [Roseiarcus fermentans]RBP12176.1 polyhydroxyalkanoate synthase [Roseiarcus fermentans]